MEEQIENIVQAQAEERQEQQQQIPVSAGLVPDTVIDRALTSGSNQPLSIEHIIAFCQKNPSIADIARFLEKEYGEGGKGVSISGQEYALWFDHEGFRIAPGRSAHGQTRVHTPVQKWTRPCRPRHIPFLRIWQYQQ